MKSIDSYRSLFPITSRFVYLNNAAVSPPSTRVLDVIQVLSNEFSHQGISCYGNWMKLVENARILFADLIHANPNEIAFVPNTSEGLSIIAGGLDWKSGDTVLVPLPDFPSNIYPWLNLEKLGVRVSYYRKNNGRFGVKEVEEALHANTKLLTVSSVDFLTGFRCDLEALGDFCYRKGVLFCVDAIQSIGVIPMDVKKFGIHFLASGGHKWLLGPMGQGCIYVSKEASNLVHPWRVGWKSVIHEDNFFNFRFDLKPDALRYEAGTMNILGIAALGAAIDLIKEVGVEHVQEKVYQLIELFYDGLQERRLPVATSMTQNERSGIITFTPHAEPTKISRFLYENNVMVSLRGDKIRLSPHFYNNVEDVEAFFRILDRYR